MKKSDTLNEKCYMIIYLKGDNTKHEVTDSFIQLVLTKILEKMELSEESDIYMIFKNGSLKIVNIK